MNLEEAYQYVLRFKAQSLKTRIADLEQSLHDQDEVVCKSFLAEERINFDLFAASLLLKRASAQIDEVVHAVGIMMSLPYILRPGENVESLSLAAGNTDRAFDLETNYRIAEYKFIEWKGGAESVRQDGLFKDFYHLAENPTEKEKYLYVIDAAIPIKFLLGGRSLQSVMRRNKPLWEEFEGKYAGQFETVSDYYSYRQDSVMIVDLLELIPDLSAILKSLNEI